ncbi:hypothetical protein Bca52824_022361 [Brassica carinata]|uniref:RNA helicase n=1 Tax=Brassica carinata TaxID=52824 RepID=A0A8X7VGL0_BRACI|nr:hypothetical protein Bca52824_022361 [Brassica carinata]
MRKHVSTACKPKKKRKKNKEKIQREDPEADLKKVKNSINGFSSKWKMHTTNIWSSIEFEFVVKIDIINMETKKKDEIMRDPLVHRDGEEYYKRIEKAWKRGYLLYEEKISEDKEDESDEEASDLEEEIRVDKISEWIDFLVELLIRDLDYLATGQNVDVKKNDPKKKSSKKVKLSVEDVKINIPKAVSNIRISDLLREKLKEKGIEGLFPSQAMNFDMVLDDTDLIGRARTGQGKTLFFVLPILESLINGPAKKKKKKKDSKSDGNNIRRGEFDNIQEERDVLRSQHKQKLNDNDVENLLYKRKRRDVTSQSTSRSESTRLQIFVRMMSGGKTIVIYANKKRDSGGAPPQNQAKGKGSSEGAACYLQRQTRLLSSPSSAAISCTQSLECSGGHLDFSS